MTEYLNKFPEYCSKLLEAYQVKSLEEILKESLRTRTIFDKIRR